MSGATCQETGRYTLPEHGTKGNTYRCACHSEIVSLHKGEIYRPHFAHIGSKSRNEVLSTMKGETIQHITAKQIMLNLLKRPLHIIKTCRRCDCIDTIPIPVMDDIMIEHCYDKENHFRADVASISGNQLYIFEVYWTHKTTRRPEKWFELDAREILEKYQDDKPIFHCIRSWYCDQCFQKVEDEIAQAELRKEELKNQRHLEYLQKCEQEKIDRERRQRQYEEELQIKKEQDYLQQQRKQEIIDEAKKQAELMTEKKKIEDENNRLFYLKAYEAYTELCKNYTPNSIPLTEQILVKGFHFLHPDHLIRINKKRNITK